MSHNFQNKYKVCANCELWDGERQIQGSVTKVPSSSTKGRCNLRGQTVKDKGASQTCNSWEAAF